MNSIRLYDEKILDYLTYDMYISDGYEDRKIKAFLAIPGHGGNPNLDLSDNNTPILPLITVIRQGLNSIEQTHIVKTHIPKLPLYRRHTDNKKYVHGSDFMPYNINYRVDIWSLTQENHTDIINQLIWKFEKSPSFPVRGIFSGRNVDISGYIERYEGSDSSQYEELGATEDRILQYTFNLTVYGQLVKEMKPTPTIEHTIDRIILQPPIVESGYCNPNAGICGDFTSNIIQEDSIDMTIEKMEEQNIPYDIIEIKKDLVNETMEITENNTINVKNRSIINANTMKSHNID